MKASKSFTCTEKLHKLLVDAIAGNPKLGEEGLGQAAFDMSEGHTLRIVKSAGPGGFFVFDKSKFMPQQTSIGTKEQRQQWLANAPDLNAIDPPSSVEELTQTLQELLLGDDVPPSPMPPSTATATVTMPLMTRSSTNSRTA